ncbi:hypothetical protein JG688_00009777 [Phytophthora aleatoria]|uniref:Uncharacterized protein n=1 Tax=Phytophthora aleatoria TaxID=2496075 RepID=A0A8J5IFY0_9STRA|nr:hypothetical protein JG688_00009777 [Phytophthora aleatoria]
MVATTTALVFATLATLATSGVDAHGTLVKPSLKFTGEGYGGNFAALVPMTALTPQQGDIFTNYPDWGLNAAAFGRAFKASKYTSLKEFLLTNQDMSKGRSTMPKTPECGFTDPTGGRCRTSANDGKFPYKKAMCEDKKRLTMYWMSTLLEWQVYIDCAKIGEGGPPASASTTPSSGGTTPATSSGGSSGAAPASTPGDAPTTQNTNTGTIGGEASSTTKPKCTPKLRL